MSKVRPHEIYAGAQYRIPGGLRDRVIVTVTRIEGDRVHYESRDMGFMCGASGADHFAKEAERVYPNSPQVNDVLELLRRMKPEQRAEVLRIASQ